MAYAGPDDAGSPCAMGYVAHFTPPSAPSAEPGLSRNFAFGSFTKVWTASAVLKLHEAKKLHLDEPAITYMERAFAKATGGNGDSLVHRFGEQVKNVTIRQLLAMRGNIHDYDEIGYQLQHLTEDLGPAFSAQQFGSGIMDQPLGSCGVYSSMSYVLLGLVLIGQSSTEWDKYDQNVWRELFPDMQFAVHGTCSKYLNVADAECHECQGANLLDMSCTNGFTCGNMVAPPEEVARFVWYLFEGHLLGPSALQEMLTFHKLGPDGASPDVSISPNCHGFCDGCGYGLGVQEHAVETMLPGHAGQTYGFTTISAYDAGRRAAYVAGIASSDTGAGAIWADLYNSVHPHPGATFTEELVV